MQKRPAISFLSTITSKQKIKHTTYTTINRLFFPNTMLNESMQFSIHKHYILWRILVHQNKEYYKYAKFYKTLF